MTFNIQLTTSQLLIIGIPLVYLVGAFITACGIQAIGGLECKLDEFIIPLLWPIYYSVIAVHSFFVVWSYVLYYFFELILLRIPKTLFGRKGRQP